MLLSVSAYVGSRSSVACSVETKLEFEFCHHIILSRKLPSSVLSKPPQVQGGDDHLRQSLNMREAYKDVYFVEMAWVARNDSNRCVRISSRTI